MKQLTSDEIKYFKKIVAQYGIIFTQSKSNLFAAGFFRDKFVPLPDFEKVLVLPEDADFITNNEDVLLYIHRVSYIMSLLHRYIVNPNIPIPNTENKGTLDFMELALKSIGGIKSFYSNYIRAVQAPNFASPQLSLYSAVAFNGLYNIGRQSIYLTLPIIIKGLKEDPELVSAMRYFIIHNSTFTFRNLTQKLFSTYHGYFIEFFEKYSYYFDVFGIDYTKSVFTHSKYMRVQFFLLFSQYFMFDSYGHCRDCGYIGDKKDFKLDTFKLGRVCPRCYSTELTIKTKETFENEYMGEYVFAIQRWYFQHFWTDYQSYIETYFLKEQSLLGACKLYENISVDFFKNY